MIHSKKFDRAADDVVDLLRYFKPYREGNTALRYVHDLDILDKHKALIPVARNALFPGGSGMGIPNWHKVSEMTGGGMMALDLALERGLIPNRELPATITLEFPWNSSLQSNEITPTLERLIQDFSGIVDAFETLCFGAITE